jgi:hypothetical protein
VRLQTHERVGHHRFRSQLATGSAAPRRGCNRRPQLVVSVECVRGHRFRALSNAAVANLSGLEVALLIAHMQMLTCVRCLGGGGRLGAPAATAAASFLCRLASSISFFTSRMRCATPCRVNGDTLKHVSGACFHCRLAHIIRRVCVELAVLRVALQFLHVVSAPVQTGGRTVSCQHVQIMDMLLRSCLSTSPVMCAAPNRARTRVEQTLQRQAAAGTTSSCRQPACCCQSPKRSQMLPFEEASAHLGSDALLHLQQVLLVQLLGPVRQRRQVPAGEPRALSARLQFAMKAA